MHGLTNRTGLGAALDEAVNNRLYDEAHALFERICAGGFSLQLRSTEMPDGEQKVYRHWSTQIEAADAKRIEAAATAVNESRSLFVRKAALARAAEVEADRDTYVVIREVPRPPVED